MVRKLALAVSLALGTVPFGAQALGLGDINTKSGLNQKFQAEINLHSVTPQELSAVNVHLAPAEVFKSAGVVWYPFLSQLRFVPQVNANGQVVIGVTTDFPIREPYLDFLIKVDWPKGRLIREYTVLLDPPVTLRSSRPSQVTAASQTTMATSEVTATAKPSDTTMGAMTQGEDYLVKANDTLWGISKSLRPSGISMEQMMMSLFHSNPDAFIKNNINLLKKGAILRVPVSTDLQDVSQAAAQAEFKDQAEAWEQSIAENQESAGQGQQEIAAAEAMMPASQDDQLKLATETGEGAVSAVEGEGIQSAETVYNELLMAQENAATSLQDADNLRGHVDELEQQLEDMQRVISLQDEQMSRLQAGQTLEADETEVAETTELAEMTEAVESVSVDMAEEVVTETSEPAMDTEVMESVPEPEMKPEPEIKQVAEPMAEPSPAQESKGLLDLVMENLVFVGVGFVLLIGLLWGLLRGKKAEDDEDETAYAPAAAPVSEPETPVATPVPEPEVRADDDESFINDFAQKRAPDIDETSQVDPIGEADVYIAYGRFDQAEEMLEQAIDEDPARVELKFKLLEVLGKASKVAAFVALAGNMKDAGEEVKNPDAWAKVAEMGAEIAPSDPLFLDQSELVVATEVEDDSRLDDDLGIPPNIEDESVDEESTFSLDLDDDLKSLDESSEMEIPELTGSESDQLDEESVLNLDTELQEEDLEDQLEELSGFSGFGESLEEDSVLQESIEEAPEEDVTISLDEVEEDTSFTLDEVEEDNEVDTKLDLARAYMEMGDAEGAQSILDEVQEEGNAAQKAEAEEILSQLED